MCRASPKWVRRRENGEGLGSSGPGWCAVEDGSRGTRQTRRRRWRPATCGGRAAQLFTLRSLLAFVLFQSSQTRAPCPSAPLSRFPALILRSLEFLLPPKSFASHVRHLWSAVGGCPQRPKNEDPVPEPHSKPDYQLGEIRRGRRWDEKEEGRSVHRWAARMGYESQQQSIRRLE